MYVYVIFEHMAEDEVVKYWGNLVDESTFVKDGKNYLELKFQADSHEVAAGVNVSPARSVKREYELI